MSNTPKMVINNNNGKKTVSPMRARKKSIKRITMTIEKSKFLNKLKVCNELR